MTRNPPAVTVAGRTHYRFPTALVWWTRATALGDRTLSPLTDLIARLVLAQGFFVSGVLKLSDWTTALYLAENEYPLAWLNPGTAAVLGVVVEVLGAVLLAVGLATRGSALALAALTIVVQTNYLALDAHLLSIALLGWYVVAGPGSMSLDAQISRGLAQSAIPLGAQLMRLVHSMTGRLSPTYMAGLRLWLGGSLLVAALGAADSIGVVSQALPWRSALAFPAALSLVSAGLLASGTAVRFVGLGLMPIAVLSNVSETQEVARMYWVITGALFAVRGAGQFSIDAWLRKQLAHRYPELRGELGFDLQSAPRVVIVGAGFGGLACAAALRHTPVHVTLVDRHNYHLFQPLLYQVATAALAPGDIATPIRGLFKDQANARVLLAEATGVDSSHQHVLVDERRIPYDYLVLASGARHSYFGCDQWEPHAPGLKQVEDATEVRRRLLIAFERAETVENLQERQALLTFVIVGGGPTGVELAGAIAEIARFGMKMEFRNFDPASARVLLIQAGPRVLPTFAEALSIRAQRFLEALGVEVMTGSRVEVVDERGVQVNGLRIDARTVLWAAGVVASPAARWLGADAERDGRIKVAPDLSVAGLKNVFAIGDTASVDAWAGKPVPGLAPAAKQGGRYVGSLIHARVCGVPAPAPFEYRHLGSLATIGRKAAVIDFGPIKLSGAAAWWLWGFVHVGFLAGFRNRVSVVLDWFWSYLTFGGSARLITTSSAPTASRQDV